MANCKPSKKSDFDVWLEEEMADPEFREEWERTMPHVAFGFAVARAREARDMTREELATAAAVQPSLVTQIENGDYDLTLASVLRLVRALDARLQIEPSGWMKFVSNTPAEVHGS